MPDKRLEGTKTLENLKHAFAGESQANRRYLYFAARADVEGHPDIAGLFRDRCTNPDLRNKEVTNVNRI